MVVVSPCIYVSQYDSHVFLFAVQKQLERSGKGTKFLGLLH